MILLITLVLLICVVVYLIIPYSPVKNKFWTKVNELEDEYKMPKTIITEEDLKVLPEVLEKYFIKNGYVGIESASTIIFEFKNVDFVLGDNKPTLKINYTAYDFTKEPARIALIDSRMFGVPFQGIDTSQNGKGSMKGVIAKNITLFNQSFNFIDSAYLAECLMHPSLALQKNIQYKQISDYSVEATIIFNGAKTSGIFNFNENYEMTSFVVEERFNTDTNSNEKWSAITSEYKTINGINRPTKFQAVWNYDSGDLVYFDGSDMKITYK